MKAKRLNIEMPEKSHDALGRAADAEDLSISDYVRRSMSLLALFNKHVKAGGVVIFRDAQGRDKEVHIL